MDTKIGFHFNSANASLRIDGKQVDLAGPKDTKEVMGKDGRLKTIEGFVAQDGTFFQVKQGEKAKTGGIDIIVRGTPEQLASYDFGVRNGSVSSARYGENSYRPGGQVAPSNFTIHSGTSGEEILREHGLAEKQPGVWKDPDAPVINENHFAPSGNPPEGVAAVGDQVRPEFYEYIPEWVRNGRNGEAPREQVYEYLPPVAGNAHQPGTPPANEHPAPSEPPVPGNDSKIHEYDGTAAIARAQAAQAGMNGKADVENPASDFAVSGNPGSAPIIENLEPGKRGPANSVDASSAAKSAEARLAPEVKEQLAQLRARIGNLPEGAWDRNLAGILDEAIIRHAVERSKIAGASGTVSESLRQAVNGHSALLEVHQNAIKDLTKMTRQQNGRLLKRGDLILQQSKTAELGRLTDRLQASGEKLIPLQKEAQNLIERSTLNDRNLESALGIVANRLDELGIQAPLGSVTFSGDHFVASTAVDEGVQSPLKEGIQIHEDHIPKPEPSIDPFTADFGNVDSTRMATEVGELDFVSIESDISLLQELEMLEAESAQEAVKNPESPSLEEDEAALKELESMASQAPSTDELFRQAFPDQSARVDQNT